MAIRRDMHLLSIEHDELDDSLGSLGALIRAGKHREATRRLSSFTARLERHMRAEEQVLFSVLEASSTGARDAPTGPMRREHGSLRRLAGSLLDAVQHDERARALQVLASLRSVLFVHRTKEEWLIHPLLVAADAR
jgi:hemerythrin-like domain-containing protein